MQKLKTNPVIVKKKALKVTPTLLAISCIYIFFFYLRKRGFLVTNRSRIFSNLHIPFVTVAAMPFLIHYLQCAICSILCVRKLWIGYRNRWFCSVLAQIRFRTLWKFFLSFWGQIQKYSVWPNSLSLSLISNSLKFSDWLTVSDWC
jgi:hypothetical protein